MQLTTLLSSGLAFAALAVGSPTPVEKRNDPTCTYADAGYLSTVKQKFSQAGIVPTLIPSIDPKVKVNVAYGSKQVNLGTVFKTTETVNAPKLSFTAEQDHSPSTTKYTYFLVDPDVPQSDSPLRMPFLHWMVEHAQPDCIKSQSPKTTVIYEALTPLSTTQHRYTFLVYREPAGYEASGDVLLQTRLGFNVNAYAAKKGLVLVGGNYLLEALTNGITQ